MKAIYTKEIIDLASVDYDFISEIIEDLNDRGYVERGKGWQLLHDWKDELLKKSKLKPKKTPNKLLVYKKSLKERLDKFPFELDYYIKDLFGDETKCKTEFDFLGTMSMVTYFDSNNDDLLKEKIELAISSYIKGYLHCKKIALNKR